MDISYFTFFRNLSIQEIEHIAGKMRKMSFTRDEVVISKGCQPNFVFFVNSGRVKESACTRSGKEIVFNIFSKGDCLGLVWGLNAEQSKTDFVTTVDTDVYAIRINEFREIMQTNSVLSQAVLAEFGKVALRFSDKLYEIRALDVAERTRAELLRYATNSSVAEDSDYVEMANLPTHEEIANSISTHREAVTREISSLKKNGVIIKTDRNHLAANLILLQKMVAEYS